MCYDVKSGTLQLLKYAKHRSEDPSIIAELEAQLDKVSKEAAWKPLAHVKAFEHPSLLVFTNEAPFSPQLFRWGLVPSWVRDAEEAKSISTKTFNARLETASEKPSFKESLERKRCLIYVDAFYEFQHIGRKKVPYIISSSNIEEPLIFAGLYAEWTDQQTGEFLQTTSIVTIKGTDKMAEIHNNPALAEPRMPLFLSKEWQDIWLLNGNNPWSIDELNQYVEGLSAKKLLQIGKHEDDILPDNQLALF